MGEVVGQRTNQRLLRFSPNQARQAEKTLFRVCHSRPCALGAGEACCFHRFNHSLIILAKGVAKRGYSDPGLI